QSGEQADAEEGGPDEPEEQHRLPAEAQLEPDRQEVEAADWNPLPGELRDAGAAGVERHRTRGEPPAVRRGDDDHVAVPVGTERHAGHDLPAPRLDRVEVLDLHAEEPAT